MCHASGRIQGPFSPFTAHFARFSCSDEILRTKLGRSRVVNGVGMVWLGADANLEEISVVVLCFGAEQFMTVHTAPCRNVVHRPGVGGSYGQLTAIRKLPDRILGADDGQRTEQTAGVEEILGRLRHATQGVSCQAALA